MEEQRDIIDICDDLFYETGLVGVRNLSHDLKEMDKQIQSEQENQQLEEEEEEELDGGI